MRCYALCYGVGEQLSKTSRRQNSTHRSLSCHCLLRVVREAFWWVSTAIIPNCHNITSDVISQRFVVISQRWMWYHNDGCDITTRCDITTLMWDTRFGYPHSKRGANKTCPLNMPPIHNPPVWYNSLLYLSIPSGTLAILWFLRAPPFFRPHTRI